MEKGTRPSELTVIVPADVFKTQDDRLEHLNDPNYDSSLRMSPADKLPSAYLYDAAASASAVDFDDESPYAEVRAAVSVIDDPNMPVNTFRTWTLGILFTVLISFCARFFSFRYPSVYVTGIVAQLASFPMGKLWEWLLPTTQFRTFGYTWSLNPGPFNIKEHVVITIMASVAVYGAYGAEVVATQRLFYGQTVSFSYQIFLSLSVQLLGFSLAGALRRFLVWPAAVLWPGALVNAALFNTLHKNYQKNDRKHMSRFKFFFLVTAGSFVWYWVPGFLWTGLSVFNWVCWIAPNNVAVNQLFGTLSGLGMGILTFDWAMISYVGSPLVTPWWAVANTTAALVIIYWIITPILYFTNTWYSKFMSVSAYVAHDNTGLPYNPHAIFTNGSFDVAKYKAYSPLFLSTTQAVSIGVTMAAFTSVIVHIILWHRKDIMNRFRRSLKDERDVHSRLMQAYPEVPHAWYGALGLVSLGIGIAAIEIFPTQLPVWGFMFAILLSSLWSLPSGILQAMTNQMVHFTRMATLISGYLFPKKPVAHMIFKAAAIMVAGQAVLFCGDMKLGHYMKVPPRIMFLAQTIAVFTSCFVVTLVQNWMFENIVDFCEPTQKDGFVCLSTKTFATSSLIWGSIGPARFFGPGAMYNSLLWCFFIGAILPFPFYYLANRYPESFWRYVNMPIFFSGTAAIPPATGANYASWAVTGFIFQFWMRRYHFRWWMRYNYILSAGLDAGVAIGMLAVFFTLQMPRGGVQLRWWGNEVWIKTADAMGTPMNILKPGETFGPPAGSWS